MSSIEELAAIAQRTANEARAAAGLPPVEIEESDDGAFSPSSESGGAVEAKPSRRKGA